VIGLALIRFTGLDPIVAPDVAVITMKAGFDPTRRSPAASLPPAWSATGRRSM